MKRVVISALAFAIPFLAIAAIAQASPTLPAAIYHGYATDPGANIPLSGPGSATHAYSDLLNPLDSADFSMTLAGTPDPLASAGVDSSISTATASAQLFYYMEVVGGSGPVPVTVDVIASLFASSYGDGSGGAAFQIQQVSGISGSTICSSGSPCLVQSWGTCSVASAPGFCVGTPTAISVDTAESLFSNTLYVIEVAASAGSPDPLVPYTVTGGGKGSADPSFAIDPITIDAGAYSLIFSDGIGNPASGPGPSSVPEPATWAVLLAGIGALAALRRVRSV